MFLTAISLTLLVSCKEKREGEETCINKPKDVQPVDWGSYNDVYTVYWNYFGYCSDIISTGDSIVCVYGWKTTHTAFYISPVPEYINSERPIANILISWDSWEITTKIAASDLTKKCFIKGKLYLRPVKRGGECCYVEPSIYIANIDDIYFE